MAETNDTIEIDELDRNILNVLLSEGRKSFRQVAEAVDSTPATVINRVDRLEDGGVVTGYSADIDYRRLGYDGLAAVEVVVNGDALPALREEVEEHDNVVTAFTITGDTDLLLLVTFPDRSALTDFVQDELSRSENVEKTITHVILDVLKESDGPTL
ncbi:MAG: Lrp/AsnC family transcriptional regulator [Candidatus Nanohaloarchaea archaeon]|nr:Lrp/AsnC family transcriptional regulator [Candidatus Nanohaloarchaea archaeon]